jgi:hypothetical protein
MQNYRLEAKVAYSDKWNVVSEHTFLFMAKRNLFKKAKKRHAVHNWRITNIQKNELVFRLDLFYN